MDAAIVASDAINKKLHSTNQHRETDVPPKSGISGSSADHFVDKKLIERSKLIEFRTKKLILVVIGSLIFESIIQALKWIRCLAHSISSLPYRIISISLLLISWCIPSRPRQEHHYTNSSRADVLS
jgi:hypothetical protein